MMAVPIAMIESSPPASEPRRAAWPRTIGRYLVFEAFARGGMAQVHLARYEASPGLSRLVAVKRLDRKLDTDGQLATRLLEEARLLFRVRHPSVVPLLDVVNEGDELGLVLEYVHGASLSTLLAAARDRDEPVSPSIAVAVVADALRGLHAAHEARGVDGASLRIVHRDVSPQNVVVGIDGVARILDFGIAKALRKDKLTKTGMTLGKVVYMAPEQVKGQSLTPQADLYSMGVVLWETLTGRAFADAIERGQSAPAPSTIASDVNDALDRVVMRALCKEPGKRFGTADEMAAELEEACARATASEITRWVESLAADELDERGSLVERVERFVAEPVASAPVAPPPVIEIATAELPTLEQIAAPIVTLPTPEPWRIEPTVVVRPRARPRYTLLTLVAIVTVLTGIVAFALAGKRAPAPRAAVKPAAPAVAPSTPAARETTTTAAPVPPPPPPPVDVPAEAPTASNDEVSFVEAAPARHTENAPRKAASKAAPRASAKPKPAAAPEKGPTCDPPFRIDADGKKRYIPECLR